MNLKSIGVIILIIILALAGFTCQEIILLDKNLSLSSQIILSFIQAICWLSIPIVAYMLSEEKFPEGEMVRELRDFDEPMALEYKHIIKKENKIIEQKHIKIKPSKENIKEGE